MEELLAVLDRVQVSLQESGASGELMRQSLNLTAQEKLGEVDVQDLEVQVFCEK